MCNVDWSDNFVKSDLWKKEEEKIRFIWVRYYGITFLGEHYRKKNFRQFFFTFSFCIQ